MNGIKQLQFGYLDANVQQNLEVFKKNFDIVLSEEDASFRKVEEIGILPK